MKKNIVINDVTNELKIMIEKYAKNNGIPVCYDIKTVEELKKIILSNDRTSIFGKKMWNEASILSRYKEIIMVNIFCEADAIETNIYNNVNSGIFDLIELTDEKAYSLFEIWMGAPKCIPDDEHLPYINRLKDWGI